MQLCANAILTNPIDLIRCLRNEKDFKIDIENHNRYKVMVKETEGTTAYCFNTPIYDLTEGRIISSRFNEENGEKYFRGSNCTMIIKKNIVRLENTRGVVDIIFNNEEIDEDLWVSPTMNGFHFLCSKERVSFKLKAKIVQSGLWFNGQHFSIMADKFLPCVSVSGLYAKDEKGNCFPMSLQYTEKGEHEYEITAFSTHHAKELRFEINFYEHKLFQDTTVESKNPDKNNAFGAVGFIGRTEAFGEQWLYIRPDFSRISDLYQKRVESIYFHVPILNGSDEILEAYIPQRRFCSFGSTWNKKVPHSEKKISSVNNGKYLTFDVTDLFRNPIGQVISYNEGLILRKPKNPNSINDFIAISTGDSYSYPQILEIKIK